MIWIQTQPCTSKWEAYLRKFDEVKIENNSSHDNLHRINLFYSFFFVNCDNLVIFCI